MKRWWPILLVVVAVVVWLALDPERREVVTAALGLSAPTSASKLAKPVCDSPVNPNVAAPTDCIPQHLANLPPDPGEAGKLTIDGIDSDKDGVRDDVQRWIAENWGHSPLAMKALTLHAQEYLISIHYGDSLGKTETRKRVGDDSARRSACTSSLETTAMLEGRAFDKLANVVQNTPERWKRARDFDYMFAHSVLWAFNGTPTEACGFDVEALAIQAGEQTIESQLRAEAIERGKQEEREERERLIKGEAK